MKRLLHNNSNRVLLAILMAVFTASFSIFPQLVDAQPGGILGGGRVSRRAAASHVSSVVVADTTAIESGKPFRLGVLFTMEDEWHIYWHTPGDAGLPTEIEWVLPEGFSAGPLQWPTPEDFNDSGIKAKGYGHEVLLFATITPPENVSAGEVVLSANASWLVCKADGSCIPGDAELTLALPVGVAAASDQAAVFDQYATRVPAESGTAPTPEATPAEATPTIDDTKPKNGNVPKVEGQLFSFLPNDWNASASVSLPLMLLFAFLGGLILNIMPCVLPVLSIKVLSFVRQADQDPKRILKLGLAFTAGVFVSFLALALVVVLARGAGGQVGWGFQMQEPRFVIIMSAVVLAFGLSLFGVFEIELPGSAIHNVEGLQHREGPTGAFFNGVLATALATPCTAPMLGPALGFAFTQSSAMIFVFFAAIAGGLSLPYLLLSAQPKWMKFIPKPGNWMNTFKQFMGFLLLATVVWLMSVLGSQTGSEGVVWTLAFLTCVALACWLIGIGTDLRATRNRKLLTIIAAVLVLGNSYFYFVENYLGSLKRAETGGVQVAEIQWQPFSLGLIEKNAADGKTTFVDFTADWCVTCKINEKTALASSEVVKAFEDQGIVPIKADWTNKDPVIGEALKLFGRSGVPLYVIFPGERPGEPILLPDGLITSGDVLEALEEAK